MIKRTERNTKLKDFEKNNLANSIRDKLRDCSDFVCCKISTKNKVEIYKMYFNGLIDVATMDANVLKPLSNVINQVNGTNDLEEKINAGIIHHVDIVTEENIKKIIEKLLSANFVLVCEDKAYIFDAKGFDKRSLDEPRSESVVKGARDCFIESSTTNIALIRRRVTTDNLKVITSEVGTETSTKVTLLYVDGVADEKTVDNIKSRISRINIPTLICPADFEEQIVDKKLCVFPQIIETEKPDKAAANLVEGKVVVIVEGFPNVYIMPAVFAMFMQAPEEYATSYFSGSFVRILRYVAVVVSLILPALYVSIATFHQEMLPTTLAESIINSKKGVPLPAFLEIIIILIAFEILLEAGARMPKSTGQAISIVGALIVGEAAVNAKLVSPLVIGVCRRTLCCFSCYYSSTLLSL